MEKDAVHVLVVMRMAMRMRFGGRRMREERRGVCMAVMVVIIAIVFVVVMAFIV